MLTSACVGVDLVDIILHDLGLARPSLLTMNNFKHWQPQVLVARCFNTRSWTNFFSNSRPKSWWRDEEILSIKWPSEKFWLAPTKMRVQAVSFPPKKWFCLHFCDHVCGALHGLHLSLKKLGGVIWCSGWSGWWRHQSSVQDVFKVITKVVERKSVAKEWLGDPRNRDFPDWEAPKRNLQIKMNLQFYFSWQVSVWSVVLLLGLAAGQESPAPASKSIKSGAAGTKLADKTSNYDKQVSLRNVAIPRCLSG